jgi:DNA-dependent RNA polymerase auxiliary subunit epsilon
MIFKVYYQEKVTEMPVREKTKSLYVEAEAERDVRLKLANRSYNIEFIQKVEGKYLDYEKQNEDFEVLEIE